MSVLVLFCHFHLAAMRGGGRRQQLDQRLRFMLTVPAQPIVSQYRDGVPDNLT